MSGQGDGGRGRVRWTGLLVGVAVLVSGVFLSGRFPQAGGHFGAWSLVPAAVTLVLAFALREVVSALFVGIALGGVISGRLNIVQEFLLPSIGSPEYATILFVYLWALGGLIGLWTRTGGARVFADRAGEGLVRGPRSAKVFAWLMGVVFHQGGTISTVLTGATVRPVADRNRVAHEELSYVVDSTASPIASILPFNVWPIYVGSLVAGTVPLIGSQEEGVSFFLRAIPFNFYAFLAVTFTFLFSLEKLTPLVGKKMIAARRRARETGELDRPGAEPMASEELARFDPPADYAPGLVDFVGPIATLLGVAIVPFVWTYFVLGQRADPALPIAEAFLLAVLVGVGIALAKGMALKDVIDGVIDGCKGVTIGAIVLALAVTLKSVSEALGMPAYVAETFAEVVPALLLPAALLVLCMAVAFSAGTSWGTYAIVFPVALPLAWAVEPDPTYLALCFGAVTGGAVFGDQCSPISDTTILSSLSTGCDLMDHVMTQLPLAMAAAGFAAALYVGLAAVVL